MRRFLALAAALALSSAHAVAQKTAPMSGPGVRVSVAGVVVGYGRSVRSSNATQLDPDYRASDNSVASRHFATAAKPSDLEVDGIPVSSTTSPLTQWAQEAKAGNAQPREVQITLLNADGTTGAQYTLARAVPAKIAMSALKAGSSEIATMDITFRSSNVTTSAGAAATP